MDQLTECFYIKVSNDRMSAQIYCKEAYETCDVEINESSIQQFLRDKKIVYGIDQQMIQVLLTKIPAESFPYTIAEGLPVKHGLDGKISYELNFSTEIDRTPDWNFRDIMRIPSVEKGQRLAQVIMPEDGQDGINVNGDTVKAIKGKPATKKPGKNVVYREEDRSFYAISEGQLGISGRYIQVQPVFEVNETISMKNGNLDFVGSIIIHGDVSAGYTVKAAGDIKVYGMVEAATVIAGGTIYISGGLAGQKTGFIKADENINIGYINQGIVEVGNNLYVENSVIHSGCTVTNHLFCQRGNIIGGIISAGKSIEAKDIGNRLSTITDISLGVNKSMDKKIQSLIAKKKELQNILAKLDTLGKKLEAQNPSLSSKLRITMLRQKSSFKKVKNQLEEVTDMLQQTNSIIGSELEAKLIVRNYIFSNVVVAFGKYKQMMKSDYHFVQMTLSKNEIVIDPLFIQGDV